MGELKLLIACLAVCSIIIFASGCIGGEEGGNGGKRTFDSEYMTFEYPENWMIQGHATNDYGV